MQDECRILRWSGTADITGQLIATWTPDATATKCGFGWNRRHEAPDADKTTVRGDFLLRLPVGTVIDARDRVEIITRFGEPVSERVQYEIDGEPASGPSGLVVRLKRVTT